jgi:hypothetical protein
VPSKEEAVKQIMSMSASDAVAAAGEELTSVGKMTIGGGTPEGAEKAKAAAALLSNTSQMVQLAHLKATDQLRSIADELDVRMMSAASGLAFMGGQIALAGASKTPINLADVAKGPIAETQAILAEVVKALGGAAAPAAPAAPTAPAAPAAPAASTAPAAPVTSAPPHLTPGPGTGRGPNPA